MTKPLYFGLIMQKVLESGSRKRSANKTMLIYLSEKLGRQRHGFEYGALEIKNHLERLLFSEIVSTVMIMLVSIYLFLALTPISRFILTMTSFFKFDIN